MEKTWHINVQELEVVKPTILSFTKFKKVNSIHMWIDNMTALHYLLKKTETQNNHLIKISKQIWIIRYREKLV